MGTTGKLRLGVSSFCSLHQEVADVFLYLIRLSHKVGLWPLAKHSKSVRDVLNIFKQFITFYQMLRYMQHSASIDCQPSQCCTVAVPHWPAQSCFRKARSQRSLDAADLNFRSFSLVRNNQPIAETLMFINVQWKLKVAFVSTVQSQPFVGCLVPPAIALKELRKMLTKFAPRKIHQD